MIINFTKNHQFTTRMKLNENNMELVEVIQILGTIISNYLSWNSNTKKIIQKNHKRMQFLKKIQSVGATTDEMVNLRIIYCRSVLEKSAIVWSSSLTAENKIDIERTQKKFAKMILKNKYTSYQESLLKLNLPTLEQRQN